MKLIFVSHCLENQVLEELMGQILKSL